MKAIVYTSHTGSTEQYARLLAQELERPVYSLAEAKKILPRGEEILYLGWIMASSIQGYKEAAGRYQIRAVCAIGMGQGESQAAEVRRKNGLPDGCPLFSLQGNFDIHKLHGWHKLLMRVMTKALAGKASRSPDEDDMLDRMQHGSERVSPEQLQPVLKWYGAQKQTN